MPSVKPTSKQFVKTFPRRSNHLNHKRLIKMEAFNRYHKCFFQYQRTLFQLIGHDVFLPNFKPGILAFAMYAVLAVFIFTNFYTLIYYDLFNGLNAFMFLCLSLQVSVRFHQMPRKINSNAKIRLQFVVKVFSVKYSDEITWMINKLHDVYKVNATTKDYNRRTLFDRFAFYTEMVFKCGTSLYFLSALSYFVYPIYVYSIKREIITLMPTYLPGIDEGTATGFVIVTCYHIVLLSVAFVSASACDFLFTMLIANTPIMANLIQMEVQQLNDILTSPKIDAPLLNTKLRNILLMHREMTE